MTTCVAEQSWHKMIDTPIKQTIPLLGIRLRAEKISPGERRDATRRNGSELIGSKVVYILQSVGSQGI